MFSIKKILLNPYKFFYEGYSLWKILGVIFFLALYITYYFQPHDIVHEQLVVHYFFVCVAHSLIPVISMLIVSFISRRIFDTGARWTLLHEVCFIIFLIFLVGFFNFLIRDLLYENLNNWRLEYFLEEVLNAYEVGAFIAFIVILLNQLNTNNRIKKHREELKLVSNTIENSVENKPEVSTEKPNINLDPTQFIFAKSCGNYTEIYVKNEAKIIKNLERITLGNLFDNLSSNDSILRVHKSYIVNLKEINSVSGNSAGLKLKMNNLPDIIVPVSRSNVEIFEKYYAVT